VSSRVKIEKVRRHEKQWMLLCLIRIVRRAEDYVNRTLQCMLSFSIVYIPIAMPARRKAPVRGIIGHKVEKGTRYFLVNRMGCPPSANKYEREDDLADARDLIDAYLTETEFSLPPPVFGAYPPPESRNVVSLAHRLQLAQEFRPSKRRDDPPGATITRVIGVRLGGSAPSFRVEMSDGSARVVSKFGLKEHNPEACLNFVGQILSCTRPD
jgi:hypothetical protein